MNGYSVAIIMMHGVNGAQDPISGLAALMEEARQQERWLKQATALNVHWYIVHGMANNGFIGNRQNGWRHMLKN